MDSNDSQRSTAILQRLLAEPGNGEAFGKFTAKYRPRMKASCARLGIQDADTDDVTSTILLQFHEKHAFRKFVFQSKEKFNHWLGRVVKRAVLTFLRDRSRKLEAWSVGHPDAQQALERVAEDVVRELATLCAPDLAIGEASLASVGARVEANTLRAFEMLVFDERKGADVAAELQMTLPAVWKARSRVGKLLQDEFYRLRRAADEDD